MALRFSKLPLAEVTIRLSPTAKIPLDLASLWRLADGVRSRLPVVQTADRIFPALGATTIALELGPGQVLGASFSNPESGLSLMLQPQIIWVSWQNATLHPDMQYPHFEAILDLLRWGVEHIRAAHAGTHPADFRAANMSYTNFLATGPRPSGQDVAKYLRPLVLPEMASGPGVFHEQNLSWRESTGIDIRVHVHTVAEFDGSTNVKGISLVTVAGQMFSEPLNWPEETLQKNHAQLESVFDTIITSQAKSEWGFQHA